MAEFISAGSVFFAALTFIVGVSAWKREFVGKRRIELTESVLALFYEAEDAIREIRNPVSIDGEGRKRKRSEGEREEESALLDRANVVFERYHKRQRLFAQLRSMRYRIMATFGSSASEPFDKLSDVLSEIFGSAQMLGIYYWPRQGRVQMTESEFKRHLEEKRKHEAVFWSRDDGKDVIEPKVREAIEKMEEINRQAVESQSGLFQDFRSWVTHYRANL